MGFEYGEIFVASFLFAAFSIVRRPFGGRGGNFTQAPGKGEVDIMRRSSPYNLVCIDHGVAASSRGGDVPFACPPSAVLQHPSAAVRFAQYILKTKGTDKHLRAGRGFKRKSITDYAESLRSMAR